MVAKQVLAVHSVPELNILLATSAQHPLMGPFYLSFWDMCNPTLPSLSKRVETNYKFDQLLWSDR